MADIKEQKLLYHLTDINNLPSILEHGLLPRSSLTEFEDIADSEIIESRKNLNLDDYVPFHFFARNPFDGRVQKDHPDKTFVLLTVRRTRVKRLNWAIILQHPLANEHIELLDYNKGMDVIDWQAMNRRDYHDEYSKNVCMAECLSPNRVLAKRFFMIFVERNADKEAVLDKLEKAKLDDIVGVVINANMFLSKNHG